MHQKNTDASSSELDQNMKKTILYGIFVIRYGNKLKNLDMVRFQILTVASLYLRIYLKHI